MTVKIVAGPFDPLAEVRNYQDSLVGMNGKYGATCLFIGTMRDFNADDSVRSMRLEHYPSMTEKQLLKILDEAQGRWEILNGYIVHRVGDIVPDETIVLVAVWSAQRGDAFDACRFIMEALKSRAPFWKKELLDSGYERWVEQNTDGYRTKRVD